MDKKTSDTEAIPAKPQAVAAAATPFAPNVKLAGDAEPLGEGPVTVGMETLDPLPDAASQKAGFYYKRANLLIQMFPTRFKRIVDKGA